MVLNKKDLDKGWDILLKEDTKTLGVRSIPIKVNPNYGIAVSVNHPDKTLSLLFEFNIDSSKAELSKIDVSGLTLQPIECSLDSSFNFGVLFCCNKGYDEQIFKDICFNIISSLSDRTMLNGFKAYMEIINRLRVWIDFLKNSNSKFLALREQIGLLGELLILGKLKRFYQSEKAWINTWRGPEKHEKDFITNSLCLEVKTKLSEDSNINISSLKQLDSYGIPILSLVICSLRENQGGTLSLNSHVDFLTSQIEDEEALNMFFKKLDLVGYNIADKSNYHLTYDLLGIRYYLVDEQFPKLTQENVDKEVIDVKYKLDYASLASFEIDELSIYKDFQ